MKKRLNKLSGIVFVLALIAILNTAPVGAQNEVYLVPQVSAVSYCNTLEVQIWVNATDFQGGQVNITYSSTCANVTSWVRNTDKFLIGGWTHYDGRDWITFSTMNPQPPLLTGEYMVGTLALHCLNESTEGCETALRFTEPSMLFDDLGDTITTTWMDGTFKCVSVTSPQLPVIIPKQSSGGGSSMPSETPTRPIASAETPTPITSVPPAPTITPSPLSTASPTVYPEPAATSREKQKLPGYGAAVALLGLLAMVYTLSRREKKGD